MYGLPVPPGDEPQHIPSYFAVLRIADAAKLETFQP
jgi:hypothetical protein